MITAQQAYSAASQVISTANSMYTTLLQAVRS
jgi:flagellar hook protein FlgE